jgi:hypothetical protein
LILTAAIDAYRIDGMLPPMLLISLLAGVQPAGEMPRIGVIEVYGARRLTEQQILQASFVSSRPVSPRSTASQRCV